MIKKIVLAVTISVFSFFPTAFAKQVEQVISLKDVKPSVLQKEFGLTADQAMRVTAYQAEYGPIQSDFKNIRIDNIYINPKLLEALRKKLNKEQIWKICKKNPALCKGYKTS